MRAAILTQTGGPFVIADDVEIDDPQAGEVRVRISHCGVCHSDLTVFKGPSSYPLPAILGHEATGTIEAVGPGVDRKIGERVVLSMRSPCGHCYQCTRGMPVLCERASPTSSREPRVVWRGTPVFRGFRLGAFADLVLVETEGAVAIKDDVPPSVAAVVGCAVQTGVGAVVNIAGMAANASTLVIGAGTVGLCVVQGAVLAGATTIVVLDPNPGRREQALAMGATLALDPAAADVVGHIRRVTGGRGVDHAFDLVCTADTPLLAMEALRPGGQAVLIGVHSAGNRAPVLTTPIVMQQKSMTGCMLGNCHPQRDFPKFLDLWRAGRLAIDRLITQERPLVEIDAAMADLAEGRGLRTVLKI